MAIGLDIPEEEALLDYLLRDPAGSAALERAIASGQTLGEFVARWKADRDAAAEAVAISPEVARRILDLPVPRWDERETIRTYLTTMLHTCWADGFDGKYGMTGNSDWRYDLYDPLVTAGLIPGSRPGYGVGYRADGSHHPEDRDRANDLIKAAISQLVSPPPAPRSASPEVNQ